MPIVLRGKIAKVSMSENDLPECVFLLAGSTPEKPEWTTDANAAEIQPWSEAERTAEQLGAHAVTISQPGETAYERAKTLPGATREERLANYRRDLERKRLF